MVSISQREKKFIEAFSIAIIPEDTETGLPSSINAGVPDYIERILIKITWWMRYLVRFFFFLFDISPFFLKLIPSTFKNLSLKKRQEYLNFWAENRFYPLRLGFLLLKLMCLITYFSHNCVHNFYKMPKLVDGISQNPLVLKKM